MVKLLLLIIAANLLFYSLSGQDSTYNISLQYKFENDTTFSLKERLSLANRLSELYINKDPDKSINYSLSAIEIARQIHDTLQIITLQVQIARTNNDRCNYKTAEKYLLKASELVQRTHKQDDIAKINCLIADNYYDWSKYELSKKHYELAFKLYSKLDNKSGIARSLIGLSSISSIYGNYEVSIDLMGKAQDLYIEIGDRKKLAGTSLGLGSILEDWGKYDRALAYFKLALKEFRIDSNTFQEINLLLHIGDIYSNQGDYSTALVYFNDALNIETEINNKKLRSICYSNMGEAYYGMMEYESALKLQKKALVLKLEVGDRKRIAISYLVIGKIYFAIENYSLAEENTLLSLKISRKINLKENEMESLFLLSEIKKNQQSYEEAYDYLTSYLAVKSYVFDIKSQNLISELSVKYKFESIEKENEILRQKDSINILNLKQQENSTLFAISIMVLISLIFFVVIYFIHLKSNQRKKNYSILAKKNKEITVQKERLSELNNDLVYSQERYRSIVENATIGMYQTLKDGSIKFANIGLVKMLGYNNFNDLKKININNDHPSRKEFIELLEHSHIISGREDIWLRKDNSRMYVNESAWVVKDYKGGVIHYEGVVEDITLRKEAENALKESQVKLRSINNILIDKNKEFEFARNEAIAANEIKSQFIANISHEIRTPLNSIIGFTELLSKYISEEKQLSYIGAIKSSSKSLLNLINDVLDLSKIQASEIEINYEPFSFNHVIQDIEQVFKIRFSEKKLTFDISISPDLPDLVFLDKIRIRQILFNLIGNALKFTEKGTVSLSIISEKCDGHVDINFIVEDTGIGVPVSEYDIIFEAFKQSKSFSERHMGGTGLGLSITKKLVDAMGGNISIESLEGIGSKFTVMLPGIEIATGSNLPSKNNCNFIDDVFLSGAQQSNVPGPEILDKLSPKFSNEIIEIYADSWVHIVDNNVVNDIISFSEELLIFAKENKSSVLIDFCNALLFHANNFDIEKISAFKSVFNDFLKKTY